MRLDYIMYIIAFVFFLIAAASFVMLTNEFERYLLASATIIVGVLFVVLGYYQRPTRKEAPKISPSRPSSVPMQSVPMQTLKKTVVGDKEEEKRELTKKAVPSPIYKTEKTTDEAANLERSCPNCGSEVLKPRKSWKMAGRPDKSGKRMQLEIGLYDCPNCGKSFREVLSKQKI